MNCLLRPWHVLILLLLGGAAPGMSNEVSAPGELTAPAPVFVPYADADSSRQPPSCATHTKAIATVEELLVEMINEARATHEELSGEVLPPLRRETVLDQVADAHSERMASYGFVAHCDLGTGLLPAERLGNAGYQYELAGESLVAGPTSPETVLNALLASPGNLALLLSPSLREIGVGFAYDSDDLPNVLRDLDQNCTVDISNSGPFYAYWTVLLGRRSWRFPLVIEREAVTTASNTVNLYLYGDGWADEMMIWNEGDTPPTTWVEFSPEQTWVLANGHGEKQVHAKVRSIVTTETEASDTIISTEGLSIIFEDGFELGDLTGWDGLITAR